MPLRFSPNRGAGALVLNALVRGPVGAAATIAVGTTSTLAEGASATVANSGTSAAAVFDFGVPRGAIPAVGFNFNTATTDSDKDAGDIWFNNATPASVTTIYFDNADRDGNTVTAWLDSLDDSTSTAKGTLLLTPPASPDEKLAYAVSGSVVDGTGYRKVTVTHIFGTVLPSDNAHLGVTFSAVGDAGDVTASSTNTFTNKTIDANGTGNSITNLEVADFAGSAIVTEAEGLASSDNDTSLPTTAAVIGYLTVGYQPLDADLTAIAGLTSAADKGIQFTGSGTAATYDLTAAGKAILDDANAAAQLATLTARGQGKETIWIPAASMWARTTNGPSAASRELTTGGDVMVKGWAFDTTTEEGVQFYLGMPKSWDKGTITFQAYWTNPSGASTETVSWGLSVGAFTNDDPLDSTDLGTEVLVSDTWLAQSDLHVTAESGAVTVGNTPIDDDMLIGQIVRSVANDNMTGDAELLGIKVHFTTNAATDA